MSTIPTWLDPTLGTMPGAGNDRPEGRAEVKPGLDPGLAVVRYLYDNSRIDAEWSVAEERGFTWWAHRFAQRVWSEPGFDDDGIEIFRVFAETDLVSDIAELEQARMFIDPLNGMSSGSALVLDDEDRSVAYIASMWVHEQNLSWVAPTLSVFAAIQVAQAHSLADWVAPALGGVPAETGHPHSGSREEPDEMLGLLDTLAHIGEPPSAWAGGLAPALRQIRQLPIVTLATGDDDGITFELPYRETTALVQLTTTEPHPALGHGLLARCSLPGGAAGPAWADLRNCQELEANTRAHFLGSWVGSATFATHVCFYPNLVALTGVTAENMALSTIGRVRWLAELGRSDT